MALTNVAKNTTTFTNDTNQVLPSTITGLIGWWKADALSLNNGDAVDTWTDSSTSANHATQSGTARPTFVTNVVNSLPVVRFDGVNDSMPITDVTTMRHYFVVMKWAGTNNLSSVMGRTAAPIRHYGGASSSGVNEVIVHQSFSYSQVVGGTAYSNGTLQGSTATLYRDYNQFQIFEVTTTTTGMSWDRICGITSGGNSYFVNGDVAEIVIFNTVLSTANRQAVETYLSKKYNIYVPRTRTPMTNASTWSSLGDISGLILWLKADSLSLNDGDAIDTWTDSSTSANNATGTTTARPLYKANILNGKPVVRFDGVNDVLVLGSEVTTARTVFVVMKWDSATQQYTGIFGSQATYVNFLGPATETGAATDRILEPTLSSASVRNGVGWYNGVATDPDLISKDRTNFGIIELQTTGNARFDNISNDRGNAGRYMHGDIAEIIVFSTVISEADRVRVESYLKNKYNI